MSRDLAAVVPTTAANASREAAGAVVAHDTPTTTLLALQRMAGNRAVLEILGRARPSVQRDDRYRRNEPNPGAPVLGHGATSIPPGLSAPGIPTRLDTGGRPVPTPVPGASTRPTAIDQRVKTVQRWGSSPPPEGPRRVWAEQGEAVGHVCEEPDPDSSSAHDPAGWDRGINFNTLAQLRSALREAGVRAGSLERLAINVHGNPGQLYLEVGGQPINAERLRAALDGRREIVIPGYAGRPTYRDDEYNNNRLYYANVIREIQQLAMYLRDESSVVMLAGCLAGQGQDGIELMRLLSSHELFGAQVVASTTTTAEQGDQGRPGAHCREPGTRVTGEAHGSIDRRDVSGRQMEWLSERARRARVASPNGIVHDNYTNEDHRPAIEGATDEHGWHVPMREFPVSTGRPLQIRPRRRRERQPTGSPSP